MFKENGHITLRGKTYAKLRYEQNHLCNRYEMRSEPIDSDNAFKYYKDMNFIGNIVYLNEGPYAVFFINVPVYIFVRNDDDTKMSTMGFVIGNIVDVSLNFILYILRYCFFRLRRIQYSHLQVHFMEKETGRRSIRLCVCLWDME